MTGGLFRRLPIREKLVAMIMITTTAVLVIASVGYLAWDYYRLRLDMVSEVGATARLVLENSSAALNFDDENAARETLATLATVPRLRLACLYDVRGNLFASWPSGAESANCPQQAVADAVMFTAGRLDYSSSGFLAGKKFGSVVLRSDTGVLMSRLKMQAVVTGFLLVAALGFAWMLSFRLQALVSDPVLQLARTAADVSARGDYSVRAQKVTDDELGMLVDAFNRMLHQIQQRETELREANRLKDEFLATLSHELRTPLNAILGWTRLLRAGALPPAQIERALEKVERNAHAQARLVEDLLEVSRIASGKMRLDLRPVDLVAIVNVAMESVRPTAEARGIALDSIGLDQRLPSIADPDRLQQVVWNLLSNAVKFTPAGGRVTVGVTRKGDVDELVVGDTGIGIEPAFIGSVFDSFRQADASSTRQFGGLGLGLSIASRLVDLHGGTIAAQSEGSGRGATFTVRLPVRMTERPAPGDGAPAAAIPGVERKLTGVTIEVVDDEPDALEMLVSVLEQAGATVVAAASADEALRLAVERRPLVLVSDLGMPGTDGFTLMTQIRATLGDEGPRFTVALTAYASERDRERSARAGYQRHLAKPVDPLELVEILAGMLESRVPSRS
ncbi:MAG TPA: ATP-binding protein [Vicinamibacterales bacterium]|nr:ATP-binding protein [Vicinamibacterales bacterium]